MLCCVLKVRIHNLKLLRVILRLKCDGTRAEPVFRLSMKRTSPFKWAVASVHSTTGSRGVRISGSNAGYTLFRSSVRSTGYTLHSPVSPSLPLPYVTVCHHISPGVCLYSFQVSELQIFALLWIYAPYIGSLLRTFRDSLSVPSSTVKPSDYCMLFSVRGCKLFPLHATIKPWISCFGWYFAFFSGFIALLRLTCCFYVWSCSAVLSEGGTHTFVCSVEEEVETESSPEMSMNLYQNVRRLVPVFFMDRYPRCCVTLWCYRFLFVSEHVYKNGYSRGRQISHRSLGWKEEKTT